MKNKGGQLTDILMNPEPINAIFKGEELDLSSINVASYSIDCINNSATIAFDLNNFPTTPPKKWVLQKFNTVRIILKMHDIEELNCNYGFQYTDIACLFFDKKEESISLSLVKGEDILFFKIKGRWLYLDKVDAYTKE